MRPAIFLFALLAACGRKDPTPAAEVEAAVPPSVAPAAPGAEAARAPAAAPAVDPNSGEPTGAEPAEGPNAEADAGAGSAQPSGVVRGTVKLAKGQKLPIAPPPSVGGQPAMSAPPCPPVDAADQQTVAKAASGGLSPVHLAITGMKVTPPSQPRVHELFIDACRLRPTLVAAQRGDTVRITNRSDTALLPQLPGDKFLQAIMRGESREYPLKQLGRSALRCGFASYCGESTIITVSHPLFALTDAEGTFRIENVPLDLPLKLHAFHPLFDVTTVEFTLSDDAREKSLELTLTPKPASALTPVRRAEPPPAQAEPRDSRRRKRAH